MKKIKAMKEMLHTNEDGATQTNIWIKMLEIKKVKGLVEYIFTNLKWFLNYTNVVEVVGAFPHLFERVNIFFNKNINSGILIAIAGTHSVDGGKCIAYNNTTIIASGDAIIDAKDASTIHLMHSFNAINKCIVHLYDNSIVHASGEAVVYAMDNSTVHCFDNVKVELNHSAHCYSHDKSSVIATGNSHVTAYDFSKVELENFAEVIECDNTVQCVDNTLDGEKEHLVHIHSSGRVRNI